MAKGEMMQPSPTNIYTCYTCSKQQAGYSKHKKRCWECKQEAYRVNARARYHRLHPDAIAKLKD